MITDWRWNKFAKRNDIMRLYFNKLGGHAIMCDNELGRNCFHCVGTEILTPRPPPHGGHDPNVQNCTGKYELHADENVHIDIGEGVDIFW